MSEQFWSRERREVAAPLTAPPPGKTALIKFRELTKAFGKRQILRGVTIDVYKGETLVILGVSGSGKTTLLRHLMGFLRPDAGTLTVDGLDVGAASPEQLEQFRRNLGVV